jgi:hypothetical protein
VPIGETASLLAGYAQGTGDALRAGGKALVAGRTQFYGDYGTIEGTPFGTPADVTMKRFQRSMAFSGSPTMLPTEESTLAAYEYTRALLPTSWITGVDKFAQVWNYRAELSRLAWREADGDAETYARLLDAPPTALSAQAQSAALRTTFHEPLGAFGTGLRNMADAVNIPVPGTSFELPLGRMVVPFTGVPLNITKTAATNSPVAFLMREPRAILAAGPSAARDILLAKIGLGSAVALGGFLPLALNNMLTGAGPSTPAPLLPHCALNGAQRAISRIRWSCLGNARSASTKLSRLASRSALSRTA